MVKAMLKEKSVLNINRLENSKGMCFMTVEDLVFTLITRNRYHTVFKLFSMSRCEKGGSSINFKLIDNYTKYPRNLQRDSNGYVLDNKKSCGRFDDDGNYNGLTSVIEDHLGSFSFKRLAFH